MHSDSAPDGIRIRSEGSSEAVQRDLPPAPAPPDAPSPLPERCNTLMLSFLLFVVIGFGVWVVSAGKSYREEYAQATATEGWHVGSTIVLELTVVKEDKHNLACSSDKVFWGLHCGGERDLRGTGPDPLLLQPYNTTGNQLLLGAGLWNSADLKEPLPQERFSVVCNYHVKGVVKSAAIRFARTGTFEPLTKTVTAGTFTDCVIPR